MSDTNITQHMILISKHIFRSHQETENVVTQPIEQKPDVIEFLSDELATNSTIQGNTG